MPTSKVVWPETPPSNRLTSAFRRAEDDPICTLEIARTEFIGLTNGFRDRQYMIIGLGYAAAFHMKDNLTLIDDFYKDTFFKARGYPPKPNDVLRMAMIYIVGSFKGPEHKRALSFAYALEEFYENGERPEFAVSQLKEIGIRGLIDRRLGKKSPKNPGALRDLDNEGFADLALVDPIEQDKHGLEEPENYPSGNGHGGSVEPPKPSSKDPDNMEGGQFLVSSSHDNDNNPRHLLNLAIAANPSKKLIFIHDHNELLGDVMALKPGKYANLRIKMGDPHNGFKVVYAVRLKT